MGRRLTAAPHSFSYFWVILYFTDWGSTVWVFSRGGFEANPFLSGLTLWGLLAVKVVMLPALLGTLWAVRRWKPRFATWLNRGLAVDFGTITIHNLMVGSL